MAHPPSRSRSRDISGVGAGAALDGYTYQLNVSILAAIDLMLAKKFTDRITLEPANEEDLAADLDLAVPGRVQPGASNGRYELVIQVKLRNTGPWNLTAFKNLLNHGTSRRPARELLDDPMKRFLLITSADVSGTLRGIIASDFDDWPNETDFPGGLNSTLPNAPQGRVAIWAGLSERQVEFEIDLLLGDLLHVPSSAYAQCRESLHREAKLRMRGSSPGVWTREDLVATIRAHGGYLASAPEVDAFVKPANWAAIVKRLRAVNAIVITGPSGTGKTWAAIALCEQMRQDQLGLNFVTLSGEPSAARSIVNRGPTLYYLEDPWGQYSLNQGSEAWSEQLPRMLREARGNTDKWYVVTTRTDMLRSGRGEDKLSDWTVLLDADQYADGQLAAIHDKRSHALSPALQMKALHFRESALDTLKTPLEVDIYFGGFANGPADDENDEEFYQRVIGLAHRDAIEATVVNKLDASDTVGWSPVLWALLATWSTIERPALVAVQAAMRRLDTAYRDGLERLTNTLVAARHLRQPTTSISFAHPSVKEGFESFVKEHPGSTDAAIELLLSALTQLSGRWSEWGLESAARILVMIKRGREDDVYVDPVTRQAIDAWIDESLMSESKEFGKILELAADVGSEESIPSEVARWILHGTQRGGQIFNETWKAPIFEDSWYDRVAADPRSREIAARFVREILPAERDSYGLSFPTRLERFAPDLAGDFAVGAMAIVNGGFDSNVATIARGAARDLEAFAPVLDAALDELASVYRQHEAARDHWFKIENGETDKSDEEHFQRSHEDDGYAAGVMAETYVEEARTSLGWQYLASHPRRDELARSWSRAIRHINSTPAIAEAKALLDAARADETEDEAWRALYQNWPVGLEPTLQQRILDLPASPALRRALAEALVSVGVSVLPNIFDALKDAPEDLIALLVDVKRAKTHYAQGAEDQLNAALASLPSWTAGLYLAMSIKDAEPAPLDRVDAEAVGGLLTSASEDVLCKCVPILIASGLCPSDAVGRWLELASSFEQSKAAAEAAAAIGDEPLLRKALIHEYAGAREVALSSLAPGADTPLPRDLIALAADPASGVRSTLVALLARQNYQSHKASLLRLAHDEWSSADAYYDEAPSHSIARAAVNALSGYDALSTAEGEALIAIADKTPDEDLRTLATAVAADRSTFEVRSRLWEIGIEPVARWIRVDALNALVLARSVEPAIVRQVTTDVLLDQPSVIAVPATSLLARHGDVQSALAIIERVGHSAKHRALLLVAAATLDARDEKDAAAVLMAMLPSDHPAAPLLILPPGGCLPANALDDLGSVRLRSAVARWLGSRLAKAG